MNRFVSAWSSVLPGSLAMVANRFYSVANLLDSQLRQQALQALEQFRLTLAEAAMKATARFPGLGEDEDVNFALETLGPLRIEAARRHLAACDERDYQGLIKFLQVTADGVRYDVGHAEDSSDVGDALMRSLDSVHDFLIAQKLVDAAYQGAQQEGVGFVFRVSELERMQHGASRYFRATKKAAWSNFVRADFERSLSRREFTRDEPKQSVTVA